MHGTSKKEIFRRDTLARTDFIIWALGEGSALSSGFPKWLEMRDFRDRLHEAFRRGKHESIIWGLGTGEKEEEKGRINCAKCQAPKISCKSHNAEKKAFSEMQDSK